jgi:hydrogenase-4 component J
MAEPQVVFYQLSRKVVSNQTDIPEDARQVMYYSLAIGHHVGVMDCFSELMTLPANRYRQWLDRIPEGEARHKLEGAFKWQEIEINRSHVEELVPALDTLMAASDSAEHGWIKAMIGSLQQMVAEPALYMMVKMRE